MLEASERPSLSRIEKTRKNQKIIKVNDSEILWYRTSGHMSFLSSESNCRHVKSLSIVELD